MTDQTSVRNWMKRNRINPFFLVFSVMLECLYLFQPQIDSGLNRILEYLQRTGVSGFESSSIIPLIIYVFVVKLSFLWRIPFLIYGFLLIRAITKSSSKLIFHFTALVLFLLPFYLALFLMPFSHWMRIPPNIVIPAWWTWFIAIFAVSIGLLYEVFEFRRWTDGKLNLPFFYMATITPYFFIDVMMQFIQ